MTSYVDEHGEWESRKISIVGALSSFITQLSIGDDLTKISLPSVLLFPYSALELGCSKGLSHVYYLLKANQETDPVARLLGVLRWYLTYTQQEKPGKKPYNPILAETHLGWVDLSDDKEYPFKGVTKFFAEQVSHHPPATAYFIENTEQNVKMQTTVEFSTSFHGNSVTAKPVGPAYIDFANKEQYVINKTMPDMNIKNVILGTRRHAWEGEVSIVCEKSGLKATLNYYEEGWYCVNTVNGSISNLNDDKKLYTFYGPLTGAITLTNVDSNKTEPLINLGALRKLKINYLPFEKHDQTSSLKVWKELSDAIVVDDMHAADLAKRGVEGAQRKRRNEGESFAPRYFVQQRPDYWEFNQDKMKDLDNQIATANDPIPPSTETTTTESTEETPHEKNTENSQ